MNWDHPDVGRIWMPEATVSYPTGGAPKLKAANVLVAGLKRPKARNLGMLKYIDDDNWVGSDEDYWAKNKDILDDINPELMVPKLEWVSVGHNSRTNMGAAIQTHRMFATTGTTYTAAAVFTWVAVAQNALTPVYNDLSIGSTTINITTNEFTASGMVRTSTGVTAAGYTSPGTTLNGVASSTLAKTFTVSAPAGTATGSAVFDSTNGAATNMFVEAAFTEGNAVTAATDLLVITWTISI